MGFFIGLLVAVGSMLGGFVAMGGHVGVIWQPWEFVIIFGMAAGAFIVAHPWSVQIDTGRATMEALLGKVPKSTDHLALLGLLFALMRLVRTRPRNEVETHVDDPANSSVFANFPKILADNELTSYICDYVRLIVIGNARPHELEALMDEEIATLRRNRLKPYHSMNSVAEGLPALGIVAAVLGIIKAMGAIDQAPALLGALLGAALVGTFTGIFASYGLFAPLAAKIKSTREKQMQPYLIVKQSLVAFMNGAMPQIAIEHGRKAISSYERPSINDVENEMMSPGQNKPAADAEPEQQEAA
ncbi:MAG: flagellar motor stator protein MotA [Pseudochelatococcus sp.]|jgi:chemotaxis protein MotA|uniref:flagellar motor stator protein MotA n=1 Tax=Pseudochelatococcus sp. TaxID=2020869 RepID=UPI003D92440D